MSGRPAPAPGGNLITFSFRRIVNASTVHFLRRVRTIVRCITNVYGLLPPEKTEIPENDTRHDAEINIQAHLFNVFGAVDNLAWVWVKEKNITRENGKELRYKDIGLGTKNDEVRGSLSADFNKRLEEFKDWFEGVENYRHALAHRIPLYIPPYNILEANVHAYNKLGQQMSEAFQKLDFDEYYHLEEQQKALANFKPWIKHSFIEKSRTGWFHAQMLADFNTIHDLGMMMHKELNSSQMEKEKAVAVL